MYAYDSDGYNRSSHYFPYIALMYKINKNIQYYYFKLYTIYQGHGARKISKKLSNN